MTTASCSRVAALTLIALLAALTPMRAQSGAAQPAFRAGTELVLVNAVVRDKDGIVRGLQRDDFTILEDGKPQQVQSFDFEDLASSHPADATAVSILSGKAAASAPGRDTPVPTVPDVDMRGRRLLVFYFDLSSLESPELTRAVAAAREYVTKQLSPVDLVAIVSFSTSLQIDQDFTSDATALLAVLDRYDGSASSGFEAGTTGDIDGAPDTGNAFTADDTEYNIFNNDRRLVALQTVADSLAGIEQKKSLIYFSSGISQSGQDNQVQLRRTVDRAVRANLSIYTPDMRGLQAVVPGGEARRASAGGQSPYSGTAMTSQFSDLAASQDTLSTLGEDTGGRAFFDSNRFDDVFARVIADTSAYYVLGYSSSNPAQDGRFRKITVRVNRPGLKLEHRAGYYAPRDFAHSTKDDREQQLQDQLRLDVSSTDLSSYASAGYFRMAPKRYYVPLSVVVPGNQIPLTAKTSGRDATLDILGIVEDAAKHPAGRLRDTVKLDPSDADALKRKIVQYQTGLELAPGVYRLKVVVRENVSGTFGSYETRLVVPDLGEMPLKLSSIVMGTQLQRAGNKDARNPLIRDGQQLVPNVTRVVAPHQHLYFYYEVYDAGAGQAQNGQVARLDIATSISFFRGTARAFETPAVDAHAISVPGRNATVFQLDVPTDGLAPGFYTCQVNVIDDAAGTFAFPRFPLYVRN
jgi:VWFA-related protein